MNANDKRLVERFINIYKLVLNSQRDAANFSANERDRGVHYCDTTGDTNTNIHHTLFKI